MLNYPLDLDDLRTRRTGESAGEHVARIVRACDGISLDHEPEKLAALFRCNETEARAKLVSEMQTNCATFARECLCLAGCVDSHVIEPYVCGQAMADDLAAGDDTGARHPGSEWRRLGPGWLMVYWSSPTNAHVEICLSVPDAVGIADHGGGGRPRNAITVEHGSILSSWGRPLQVILDPERLCTCPATGDDPYV